MSKPRKSMKPRCSRKWSEAEDKALADWVAVHGPSEKALWPLAQKLDRTVSALMSRGRIKGLWKPQIGWRQEEVDRLVEWAKVHGASSRSIFYGLKELGIERSFDSARYYLYREGVLFKKGVTKPPEKARPAKGETPAGEAARKKPAKPKPPEKLLPPELLPVYRRLLDGQREIADSISTYDKPAFVRYVQAAQFWNECPESLWGQGQPARGRYGARVSEVRQAKTKGGV